MRVKIVRYLDDKVKPRYSKFSIILNNSSFNVKAVLPEGQFNINILHFVLYAPKIHNGFINLGVLHVISETKCS